MVGFEDKNLLEVKSVHTPKESRDARHASRLLAEVCKEADADRVILVLAPDAYDAGPLDNASLEAWYGAAGFARIQDDPVLMCRDPVVSVH